MASTLSGHAIKQMIGYFYLVAYCPSKHVSELKKASRRMRTRLAKEAGFKMKDFTENAIPEVAWRIVAYQQATREPDQNTVMTLMNLLKSADSNPVKATAYQILMADIAAHPGRAKEDNRLHRKKGCQFCAAPCRYGFFTLISDPNFAELRTMLESNNRKPLEDRDPVNILWSYTARHLWKVLGVRKGFIQANHLGNLSYCLLMLATAKSRFALPETQLKKFQEMNLRTMRNWPLK